MPVVRSVSALVRYLARTRGRTGMKMHVARLCIVSSVGRWWRYVIVMVFVHGTVLNAVAGSMSSRGPNSSAVVRAPSSRSFHNE